MRTRVLALALAASSSLTIIPAVAASAETLDRRSARLLNNERRSRGLPALSWNARAASVARAHSADMARDGELRHNRRLPSQMDGWSQLGENVGTGDDVDFVHEAFMASAPHRENMLDKEFEQIGVGVVTDDDGMVWITHVFFTPEKTRTVSRPPAKPRWETTARPARPARRIPTPAPDARLHPAERRVERKGAARVPLGSRLHPLHLAIPFGG